MPLLPLAVALEPPLPHSGEPTHGARLPCRIAPFSHWTLITATLHVKEKNTNTHTRVVISLSAHCGGQRRRHSSLLQTLGEVGGIGVHHRNCLASAWALPGPHPVERDTVTASRYCSCAHVQRCTTHPPANPEDGWVRVTCTDPP